MVTGFYILPLAILYIWLSASVIKIRRREKIGLGDGGHPELLKAMRAHANFAEYTPILVIIMLTLELSNAPIWTLHIFGALLVVSRSIHAFGLLKTQGTSYGRFIGMVITFSLLFLGSLATIALALIK